jgi:alpha-mannosidase
LDWQERHKILKVAFPVGVYTKEAIHEIQFGYVKRPNHKSRQADKDRYEVCNHRYTALCDGAAGAAVLNDGKYGVNVVDNEIRLTLLRAPMMPDMKADQGNHRFTYSFYPFGQSFAQSDIVCQAAELNEQPIIGSVQKQIENRPVFVPMQKNIVVETIKPADTVENALLVRAYESVGIRTLASFQVAENIKKVEETDMLEEDPQGIVTDNVAFGPFEIKTFLLYL